MRVKSFFCAAVVTATLAALAQSRLAGGEAAALAAGPIALTVADVDREAAFYTNVLSFEKIDETRGADSVAGIAGAQSRTAHLKLGRERVDLIGRTGVKPRPIPSDSRSNDRWFQHIAIVVSDMDRAYARLRSFHVRHVSTEPQTLPAWNPNAGGIKAFYFQDPEDHVLEIIWFPPGKGDPRWQQPDQRVFLGIDHTAIVVSDTENSLKFYRDSLGLRVAGTSENWGVEQEHLNQIFGARLRITGLRAETGPGIEFLEYITPPGGRDLPPGARVDDLVAWRTTVVVDSPVHVAKDAGSHAGRVLPGGAAGQVLLRDPDGHLIELRDAKP